MLLKFCGKNKGNKKRLNTKRGIQPNFIISKKTLADTNNTLYLISPAIVVYKENIIVDTIILSVPRLLLWHRKICCFWCSPQSISVLVLKRLYSMHIGDTSPRLMIVFAIVVCRACFPWHTYLWCFVISILFGSISIMQLYLLFIQVPVRYTINSDSLGCLWQWRECDSEVDKRAFWSLDGEVSVEHVWLSCSWLIVYACLLVNDICFLTSEPHPSNYIFRHLKVTMKYCFVFIFSQAPSSR